MFRRANFCLLVDGLPRSWQIAICLSAGIAVGMTLIVVRVANALSYLSETPEVCVNCHVMTDAYVTWQRGSHGGAAVCVDCHVPHANLVSKLAFKAGDGLKHSWVFTLRKEPQVLRLAEGAVGVVQDNCVRCHVSQLAMVRVAQSSERKCWDCHSNIHGRARSLSSSPFVLRPRLPDVGFKWPKKGDGR